MRCRQRVYNGEFGLAERAVLTVFPEGKIARSPQNKQHDELDLVKKYREGFHSESCMQEQSIWLVRAIENITVAPRWSVP